MNHAKSAVICSLIGLLATAGCEKASELAGQVGEAAKSAAGAVTNQAGGGAGGGAVEAGEAPSEDDILNQKLNLYVDCINSYADRAFDSRGRYLSWVDEKTGPTGKEKRISYGLYTMSDPKDCDAKVKQANELRPDLPPLEEAATAYAAALMTLHPLLEEANTYYERENYKDDGAAKGRELHPKLLAGWAALDTANAALRKEFSAQRGAIQARELAELEAKGKNLRYYIAKTMNEARILTELGEPAGDGDFGLADADAVKAQAAAMETLADEYTAYVKAHEDEANGMMMLSRYTSAIDDFAKQAKLFSRRVVDKDKASRSELSRLGHGLTSPDGTFSKLQYQYNQMVSAHNSLR
ncbi:MAG: YiiG family protein [Myxococcota bacterium]